MSQNLLSQVLEFLRRKMWSRRWQRAVTCLAAVAVFGVTYALILPAITMTNVYPTLFAEELSAWSGDELTVKVTAEAEEKGPERTFVLKAEGEGADLSDFYAFNEEGICVITDEEGKEIELHRSIRDGKKDVVDYWFTLGSGTKTSFTLNLIDEVDDARFAEIVEAVKKEQGDTEEKEETATASDAGKSAAAAAVSNKTRSATASNAGKASASSADVKEANALAAEDEEKIVTEKDDDGFEQILDGAVINDIESEDEEEIGQTEIVASLKLYAGLGKDYDAAVKDAEKNADKRGNAEVKLAWKDVVAVQEASAARSELSANVNGANIAVFYDETAGIPAGARLSVAELEEGSDEYRQYLIMTKNVMANATESDASKAVSHARFFDITILDEDGNEIEPEAPVKVVISYDEGLSLKADADLNVVHFKEEEPQVFKPGTLEKNEQVEGLSFTTDSFSVYAVVGMETLTTEVISAEGKTYTIKVSYGPEAEVPGDAALEVREILEGSAEYKAYSSAVKTEIEGTPVETASQEQTEGKAEEAEKEKEEQEAPAEEKKTEVTKYSVLGTRLFDISIVSGGEKIEPKAPVKVEISCEKNFESAQENKVSILNFDSALKVDEKITPEAEAGDAVSYETSSLAVYAVVWTAEITEPAGTVTFEGEGYTVSVTYTEKAEIPLGTKLTVFEYDKSSEEYQSYYDRTVAAMDAEEAEIGSILASLGAEYEPDPRKIVEFRSFDFTLEYNGRKIEPKDTVILQTVFHEGMDAADGGEMKVVHFAEQGPDLIGAVELSRETEGSTSVTCGVDSFSAYTYSMTVVGTNQDQLSVTQTDDPDWIVRGGTTSSFISNLPLGTVHVDASRLALTEAGRGTNFKFNCSKTNGADDFTFGPGGAAPYCVCLNKTGVDWSVQNGKDRNFPGRWFTLTYPNAAILQDGTTADFVLEFDNFTVINRSGSSYPGGNKTGVTDGSRLISPQVGGIAWDFDVEMYVKQGDNKVRGTFLFGMVDIDVDDTLSYEWYKVKKLDDGTIIGWGKTNGSGSRNFTLPLKESDKIYLYNDANGQTPLYWTDSSHIGTTTRNTGLGQAYAKYVLKNGYLTTEPRNHEEGVTFLDGWQSRVYIPQTNFLNIIGDDIEGGRLSSSRLDSDTFDGGFFMLTDASGFKINWSGNGAHATGLVSNRHYMRIVSSTDEGGSIGTWSKNYANLNVPYGFDRRPWLLTSLTVPKGKTQTYEMHPDPNYALSYVVVGQDLNDQEPFENHDLNPAHGIVKDKLQNYRFPYSLDYVNPLNGTPGTYKISGLTAAIPVTTEHGTINITAFEAVVGSDGNISSLIINGNAYTKGEDGTWSSGDSLISEHQFLKALYKKRYVGTYDYIGGTDNSQTICDAELSKIRYKVTSVTEGGHNYLRTNVIVADKLKNGTESGSDGWDSGTSTTVTHPFFNEDENGTVTFTFNNVQNNWRIHCHWEKEDPKNLVTIKKVWIDSNNNYHSRPDNLTAYVDYTVEEEGQEPTTTRLTTGVDKNINDGLTWIKDGNEWRYTYEIPFGATVEEGGFGEEELSDYFYLNEPNSLQTKENEDGTVEFVATLKNRWQYLQSFEFNKIDYEDTEGLGGAEFQLFSDPDCLHPLVITDDEGQHTYVATSSDAEGIVQFEHLYVGTYYMAETVKPGDYDENRMVYCLEVHFPAENTKLYVYKPGDGSLYDPSTISGIDDVEVAANNSPKPANQDKRVGALGIKDAVYYITNYSPYNYDIILEKQNMSANTLSGAQFKLYKNEVNPENLIMNGDKDYFETGNDGKILLLSGTLRPDSTYFLEETKAPTGYIKPDSPIGFIFEKTADGPRVRSLQEGGEVFDGTENPEGSKNYEIIMVVKNTNGQELPHTGGPGTTLYTLSGMILLLASALLYGFRRRHEERRSA